jgi:hypothetical protein
MRQDSIDMIKDLMKTVTPNAEGKVCPCISDVKVDYSQEKDADGTPKSATVILKLR